MNEGVKATHLENASTEKCKIIKASGVSDPLVSVIIPVYNMESRGYLDDLISALKSQVLESIEFILVDDCSIDRSLAVALDMARDDNRFAVLASRKNGRQGAARNIGLDVARGRYIGFVDGDDAIDPGYYKELLCVAEKSGAEIVVAPFVKTDERLNRISEPIVPFSEKEAGEMTPDKLAALIQNPAHIWCCLYAARLFKDLGIRFPEGVFFEDNPTCLNLLCSAKSIGVLSQLEDAPTYYYRQHGSSTDHRVDNLVEQIRDRMVTSDLMLSNADTYGYRAENNDAIELYYYRLALLNTLSKVAQVSRADLRRNLARAVRNHVRENVRPVGTNGRFFELPIRLRLQIRMALACPSIYAGAMALSSKMRS